MQFHQCSVDVSISLLLSSHPCVIPICRGLEGLKRGSETGPRPENLLCWPCPSHHSEEPSLHPALQPLCCGWPGDTQLSSAGQKENSDRSTSDFSPLTTLPVASLILIFFIVISSCIALTKPIEFGVCCNDPQPLS